MNEQILQQKAGENNGKRNRNGHDPFDQSLFPEVFSAAELMNRELPPPKWVVPDLLPEGVTVFAGKPKMGKSWLALGIAIAVATGGVALGTKPVERGRVLYLALEDNQRRLQRRLRKLAPRGLPDDLDAALEWNMVDEGGAERIDAWCSTHPATRLIVVDTLKKIRPRNTGRRGLYDVDYEALEPLIPVAAEQGVAVLVVHHLRQMSADDPLEEISGSNGLTGGVDNCWVLRRERGKADAYLHVDGRDIEETAELALGWDANAATWAIMGEAEAYKLSEARTQVLNAIEQFGGNASPTEVAEYLGKSVNTIKQTLWRMANDSQLSASSGRYSICRNLGNPVTGEEAKGYSVTEVTGGRGEEAEEDGYSVTEVTPSPSTASGEGGPWYTHPLGCQCEPCQRYA